VARRKLQTLNEFLTAQKNSNEPWNEEDRLRSFIKNPPDLDKSTDDEWRAFFEREDQLLRQKEKPPKLNIDDFDILNTKSSDSVFLREKATGNIVGEFPYKNSKIYVPQLHKLRGQMDVPLEGYITMSGPHLEPEFRQRGLGEQVYKKIEELTGKKILPDTMLSDYSSALHQKKGLGKSFGKQEYEPDIIKLVSDKLDQLEIKDPELKQKLAKNAFENFKKKMLSVGVTDFKSVAPLLVKGGIAAGTGGLSLAAEAAEQASESEPTGASPDNPDYWLEKGVKDPAEQERLAKLTGFKQRLTTGINYNKIPSAHEKPELKKYKEAVLDAEKEGTLLPNYVEKIPEEDIFSKLEALKRLKK
jgi:hypothetical protein